MVGSDGSRGHSRVAVLTGRFIAGSDTVSVAVPPFLFEARFGDYVLQAQHFRICREGEHGHFDRLDRRTDGLHVFPGVDPTKKSETVSLVSEAPKLHGSRLDSAMQYYPVMPAFLYPGYLPPPPPPPPPPPDIVVVDPAGEDVQPEPAEPENPKPEEDVVVEGGGGGGDDPEIEAEADTTMETSFVSVEGEGQGQGQGQDQGPEEGGGGVPDPQADTESDFAGGRDAHARVKRAVQTRLRGCQFKTTVTMHKSEFTSTFSLHEGDPDYLGTMTNLVTTINWSLAECCTELMGPSAKYDSAWLILPKVGAHIVDEDRRAAKEAELYNRVSLAVGPRLWVTFSDDRIWQLLGFDAWNVTRKTSLRRHPKKKSLFVCNLYQNTYRRFLARHDRKASQYVSGLVDPADADFIALLKSRTLSVTVGFTKHESQATFDLSTAKIHRPEVAPNAESPPPLLTYYFMNALLSVLEMMLPGGMSDSGISKKFQADAFPKLVLPSLEAEGLERGLFQLTVTATAEGARKMGLDPRAFPIEIDPAAGYTSEGPGVFLDPRAELEGTAEQQAFFLEGDNLKSSYEAAALYIALGYMDWDRGLRGLGYGVKLMSLEPSMTDYLANSAFGRTYANRASRLFQPYIMQDEAEAAVAAGLGPNDKGFAPDLTLTLCEDARDENSGLLPDKGYRLYSANSGTAKFDFEIAPSDVDFVETDNFSEDDPVGPTGPVRLLVRSKSRMKLEEEEIAGEEGFADLDDAAAAGGGGGGGGAVGGKAAAAAVAVPAGGQEEEGTKRFAPVPLTEAERDRQKALDEREVERLAAGGVVAVDVARPFLPEDQEAFFTYSAKKPRLERCPFKAEEPLWLVMNEAEPRNYLGDRQNAAVLGRFLPAGRCLSANECLLRYASQYSRLHLQLVHSGFSNYVFSNPPPDDRKGRPVSDWDGFFQLTMTIRPATSHDY